MNEKEFNLAILKELRKIAGKVFAKVKVSKDGTYTAAELWNEKDAFGESIVIDYKGTESDIYTAEIGTFKMQVTPQKLWYVLWKFEKLCNVKQSDKIRFTYGEAEYEIVNEKAMYYTGSMDRGSYNHETGCCEITGNGNYKVVTRKVSLKKLSEKLAVDKKERTYYKSGDVWYIISDKPLQEKITDRIKNEPDYLFGLLSKFDFSVKCELNPIYKALYEAMKSERINNTPEQRKSENKPKNTVICEVVTGRTNDGVLRVEQKELKSIGNSLYKDDKDIYFWYGIYCYCIGAYTRGVAVFLKEQGNNIRAKIREMIEQGGITTESAKILYEEMRKKDAPEKPESVHGTNEDYPPEPYNKEKSENVASLATIKTRNVTTSYERFQDRTICGRFQKNMCPNYLRQKVFPTESFQSRCKIRRYKPFSFLRYTNYHSIGESAANRTGSGKSGGYSVVTIRGSTG